MNQVILGASIPFAIALIIYICNKCRASIRFLIALPILMGVSAIWAIAPDIPRVLGLSELYSRLAADPRCNIFFWHYTIDQMENDSPLYMIGFIILIAGLLSIAWREVYLAEKGDN